MTLIKYNWDYLDPAAYNNRTGRYKYRRQWSFILRNSENCRDRVLDLACGSGRFTLPLSVISGTITGIDISPEAIRLLQERCPSVATRCEAFMDSTVQGPFSLILCIEALGNFADQNAFFTKVNTLLEPGGMVIFSCTNPGSWRFQLRKVYHWISAPHPYTELKLDELTTLLARCGFKAEAMEGMNWIPLPVNSNSRFVGLFAWIEKTFRLSRWISQSPWILVAARKNTD